MAQALMQDTSFHLPGTFKSELDVPDLMGSSSSISFRLNNSISSLNWSASLYQSCNGSCNGSFNQSFQSCSSASQPAFLNSGFFKKKQTKAAKKIQTLARGFLVRLQAVKAPVLIELAGIQRRKEEELERIELGKKAEMEAIRQEMEKEFDLVEEAYAEAKQLLTNLKEEHFQCKNENAKLKAKCKDLKKFNKQLKKDGKRNYSGKSSVEIAMKEQQITNLEKQNASTRAVAEQCLEHFAVYQEGIREADEAAEAEKEHVGRLKACISAVFDLVEPRSESLTRKLLKITDKNKVFLVYPIISYHTK